MVKIDYIDYKQIKKIWKNQRYLRCIILAELCVIKWLQQPGQMMRF